MVTLDKDDFIKGIIDHKKEDIPKSINFFLKPGITVNEGDDVLLTGNYTSNGGTNDTTIFKGRIENINLQNIQKVAIVSKADEINNIKPVGDYHGYTECTLGDLINKYCAEVSCPKTQDTTIIRPNEDVFIYAGWNQDVPYGDGDADFFDEIDEAVSDGDTTCILRAGAQVGYVYRMEFGFTNHALAGTYHYSPYKVDVVITMRKTTGSNFDYKVNFFDGQEWKVEEGGTVDNLAYVEYTETFDNLIGLSEDDINNFKMYIYGNSVGGVPLITKIEIVVYYRYYHNLSKATYKSTQTYSEIKTLKQIFNWAKLQELKTWYLDPMLEFNFNDGNIDSGVNITNTDKLIKIEGKKQIKNFDKVILLGGISGGAQLTSTAGVGDIIYTDTFANITNLTTLNALAAQILSDVGNYPLTVQMFRVDSTKGLIQPGEEVSIGAGIKYSGSSNTIAAGQYKIDKIRYWMANGVYKKVDLTLSDGMIFRKKESQTEQDQETNTLITQVSTGAYTNAEVDARIVVQNTNPAGTIDQAIDALIEAHRLVSGAHSPKLNEIANPSGDKEFNFANKHLHFKWVAPASGAHEGAFEIEASGAFSGDLIHIHQHTGNVGANTYMVFIECEDADASCLHLIHGGNVFNFGAAGLNLNADLTLAATRVIISADADLTFTFGRAQIDSRFADMMTISHRDMSGQDEYAFGQLDNGNSYINAPTGKLIYFHINDVEKMSLGTTGLAMSVPIIMGSGQVINSADEDLTFTFGRCVNRGVGDYAYWNHRDASYAIGQTSTGRLFLNTTGNVMDFLYNNVLKMRMSNTVLTMNIPIVLPGAPTIDLHASTKKYVDDSTIATLTLQQVTDHGAVTTTVSIFNGGLTLGDDIDMDGNSIINLVDPVNAQDAATLESAMHAVASNDLIFSNDAPTGSHATSTPTKVKGILVYKSLKCRIYHEMRTTLGGTSFAYSKVYVNGVAKGAEHESNTTGWTAYTDDIEVVYGDDVQIYAYEKFGAGASEVKNMRIKYIEFMDND